jgi:3-oxoacyl-[acyl-carrier protein] reductase
VLIARNRENLDQTALDVKKSGAEPLAIDLDLSDPDAAGEVKSI